ncbi:hypothetical protein BU23DRAFT_482981, partial [Bimuria novae-zelandiae CBS 107.79]
CLGVKFSQVEFVVVLTNLFRQHRIAIVKQRALETDFEAVTRAWKVANECEFQMLLRMKDPDRVKLSLHKGK